MIVHVATAPKRRLGGTPPTTHALPDAALAQRIVTSDSPIRHLRTGSIVWQSAPRIGHLALDTVDE